MTIFVDLDQTLADFDRHYLATFGIVPDKQTDNVGWNKVRAVDGFYRDMPPMPDMRDLWNHVAPYRPIILTGVPSSVKEAPENKRAWVRKHLGDRV